MDSWPQDHHRHKRTFGEMSQHTSLSPSPLFFSHPAPSISLDIPPNPFERRRTSHPHNEASQPSQVSSQSMGEFRMGPFPEPVRHASQATIIDLTADSPESEAREINARYVHRRPHLGRSDAISFEDIIDLTDDTVDDDEIEIIAARVIREPSPPAPVPVSHRRLPIMHPAVDLDNLDNLDPEQPEMFIPREPNDAEGMLRDPHPFLEGHEMVARPIEPPHPFLEGHDMVDGPIQQLGIMANRIVNVAHALNNLDERVSVVFQLNAQGQRMPELDYHNLPFIRPPRSQPKPQHQPPSAPKEGFTRSLEETDKVICPACENELVASQAGDEEPAKKPSARAQSKKDREEHPFWVVKDCGHVYCNKCYQTRKIDKKNKRSTFPQNTNMYGKLYPICAVEDCPMEVGDKKHWVGVFM